MKRRSFIWPISWLAAYGIIQSARATPLKLKGEAVVPQGWTQVTRANQSQVIRVSIGLAQHRFHELEQRLVEVSHPSHHRYGQHLTAVEVQELVKPSHFTIESVLEWLQHILPVKATNLSTSPAGDWLYLSLTILDLEKLLGTKYYLYCHNRSGRNVIRTLQWSVPYHLDTHIQIIEPTTAFIQPRPAQWKYGAPEPLWEQAGRLPTYDELVEEDKLERGSIKIPSVDKLPANPTVQDACNRLAMSPLCLRVLYGMIDYQIKAPQESGIGVVNFLGETANRSDVDLFLKTYRSELDISNIADDFEIKIIAGGEDQQTPNTPEQMKVHKGSEGALDAQVILGLSWPIPMTAYNVGGRPPFNPTHDDSINNNEPYLTWLSYMKTLDNLPSVISISYAEDEKTVPPEYARRVCAELAQLGARGVSVLVASGDFGVGKDENCFRRDGERQRDAFMPSFPASCPYVTAVGATRFLDPEMVAFDARTGFSTGGGFSDLFPRPSYQHDAVKGYLELVGDQFSGLYNPDGRAFPDVSSQGYHFVVMYNGTAEMQDGTSASTPTMAAIIAMVNDGLLAEGRPPLGFLNPWIYSSSFRAFTDVTTGSNLGCNTTGFPATKGWDAASGFGTPWFPDLMELATQEQFRSVRPWYYST
ncbi:tripeptidyl peptidase [Xylariaceae sp. FL0662B]|nr:tripeptidyl peptidase [Xylariaceae sp. FL0662B]